MLQFGPNTVSSKEKREYINTNWFNSLFFYLLGICIYYIYIYVCIYFTLLATILPSLLWLKSSNLTECHLTECQIWGRTVTQEHYAVTYGRGHFLSVLLYLQLIHGLRVHHTTLVSLKTKIHQLSLFK